MNPLKSRLLEGLERRKSALLYSIGEGVKLPYHLHEGHWLRDVMTMIHYLKEPNSKDTKKLINNLPRKED